MITKLRQVFQFFCIVVKPEGFFSFLSWKPFSITSFKMLRRLKTISPAFKTIIDGGANAGQFARAAVETYPSARVISFEPLLDLAKTLEKNLSGSKNFRAVQSALGSRNGKVIFHRNSHSHSSSALPLHENHEKAFPGLKAIQKLEVPIKTLDSALKGERLVAPVLLKLDLQGFEMEALRGASKILRKVQAVLLETSFEPMYKGETLFPELESFLGKYGFRFTHALDFLKDSKGNIVQMDALFTKK